MRKPFSGSKPSSASPNIKWLPWSGSKAWSLAYSLDGGFSERVKERSKSLDISPWSPKRQTMPIIGARHSAWSAVSTDISKAWTAGLASSATHKPTRSVERQLHPPAPHHNFSDPFKNEVLHQDWTSFFCSVVSDAASLLLEQPPAKAGTEISRAAQRRAEMRNIACFTRMCIVAGNLSSLRIPLVQWCRGSWVLYGSTDPHPSRRRMTCRARNSEASSINCFGSVTSGWR